MRAKSLGPYIKIISLTLGKVRLAAPLLFLVSMALLVTFLVLIILGSSRSFLVEARTEALQIVFGEGQNIWRLPETTLCLPIEMPRLDADKPCGTAFRPDGPQREEIIAWPQGARIDVTVRSGNLYIAVAEPSKSELTAGSFYFLSEESWAKAGALTFRASATVGQDLQSGSRNRLLNGRWEAREAGLVTSLFRNVTEVVKEGVLPTGSKATILIDGEPAKVYGHFAQSAEDNLTVNMVSQLGNTALSLNSFGLDEPLVIEPDWVDSAISSPLLLALAALFSILASVSQVFSDTSSAAPRKKSPE